MIKCFTFVRGTMKQPVVAVQYMDGHVEYKELSGHEIRLRMLELAELLVETDR